MTAVILSAESKEIRIRVVGAAALIVFLVILGRLFFLQGLRGEDLRNKSTNSRIRPEILAAPRGRILDRRGEIIAGNRPSFYLTLDPLHSAYRDRRSAGAGLPSRGELRLQQTLETLSVVLDVSLERLKRRLELLQTGPAPMRFFQYLTFEQRSRIWERKELIPGVSVDSHPLRYYPHGILASHLLGYLGEVTREELEGENIYHSGSLLGRAGLERSYENDLRNQDGKTYVEVDAIGRKRDLYEGSPQRTPEMGFDLVTSIDLKLQRVAEAAFDSLVPRLREGGAADTSQPAGGIVVLDCRTGDVLSLVSRPAFDPGQFTRGLSQEAWEKIRSGRHPLLCRPLQSKYPPGSVFKIVTALVAFEEGLVDRSTKLSACTGSYLLGNRVFRCWNEFGHGILDLIQAIGQSCDIYFYQLGRMLGFERLTEGARAFRMDQVTGIDIEGEAAGWIPRREDYIRLYGDPPGPGVALNLSIGQGELLFTPLELAVLYAAVANGGDILTPRIGLKCLAPDGAVIWQRGPSPEIRGRLSLSERGHKMALEALEEVIQGERGTARSVRIKGFRLGGKTGTAQNPHGRDHALFAAIAPIDDPQFIVVVVVEEAGHGGSVAAPIAKAILEQLLVHPDPAREVLP